MTTQERRPRGQAQEPKNLTATRIEHAKPKPGEAYELIDAGLRGFRLRVQPTGQKSFILRYRFNGAQRVFTIGDASKLPLKAAHEIAHAAFAEVAAGRDPAQEKQAAKRSSDIPESIDDLVTLFLEKHAKLHTRESTWQGTERILNRYVLSEWKGRRLGSIKRRDVIALLDSIASEHSVHANRVLAALRKMFNWAIERDLLEVSPCFQVKAPSPEGSRDRVLSDDELRLVYTAMEKIEVPFGPYLKVLTLTLQRRSEVAGMRWCELNIADRTWTIPAERAKNGLEHIVPLPAQAMAIIEALPKHANFVFSTTGNTPISGFAKLKRKLDALLVVENGGASIVPWRIHDLRRTGASKMPRLGMPLPVIEKVLNHISGSFAGIVGVYQRHAFLDEKRDALRRWADFLDRLGSGADNVVDLDEHRQA
ncbi:MAG: integrase arm-type DNA-binding domain-containing protein [Rhodomicrobium sp.]